jgi:hypothetical protein
VSCERTSSGPESGRARPARRFASVTDQNRSGETLAAVRIGSLAVKFHYEKVQKRDSS